MKLSILAVLLLGCTPQPTPVTPTPDASDAAALGETSQPTCDAGTTCQAACTALAGASCHLGGAAGCACFMQTLSNPTGSSGLVNKQTGKQLTCDDVAKVKTRADAVALGCVCAP